MEVPLDEERHGRGVALDVGRRRDREVDGHAAREQAEPLAVEPRGREAQRLESELVANALTRRERHLDAGQGAEEAREGEEPEHGLNW